jgi:DNA-binding transcriptional LysR family regulator
METNSILTLALAVLEGQVCSVVPGAVLGAVMAWRELQALALVEPELQTPVGFMLVRAARHSHTVEAALALARDAAWLRHAARHSGVLRG